MPHHPRPFYRGQTRSWYVQLHGRQVPLGPDREPKLDKDGNPVPNAEVLAAYHRAMTDAAAAGSRERDGPPGLVHGDRPTLDVLNLFLDWVERRKSPRTYDWYHRHLAAFVKHAPKGLTVSAVRSFHVTRILDARDAWSLATKHGFARCVQRTFRWAARRNPSAGLRDNGRPFAVAVVRGGQLATREQPLQARSDRGGGAALRPERRAGIRGLEG